MSVEVAYCRYGDPTGIAAAATLRGAAAVSAMQAVQVTPRGCFVELL